VPSTGPDCYQNYDAGTHVTFSDCIRETGLVRGGWARHVYW